MYLSKLERETIILYNEQEQTASVYTHNAALRRKLEHLAQERPDECQLERVSYGEQAMEYRIPKRWVKINAGRVLSEEQKAALTEHLHQAANLPENRP